MYTIKTIYCNRKLTSQLHPSFSNSDCIYTNAWTLVIAFFLHWNSLKTYMQYSITRTILCICTNLCGVVIKYYVTKSLGRNEMTSQATGNLDNNMYGSDMKLKYINLFCELIVVNEMSFIVSNPSKNREAASMCVIKVIFYNCKLILCQNNRFFQIFSIHVLHDWFRKNDISKIILDLI